MATKTVSRRLTEAELNAPDLDDEGRFDVEAFPLPSGKEIKNPVVRDAWEEALKILGG